MKKTSVLLSIFISFFLIGLAVFVPRGAKANDPCTGYAQCCYHGFIAEQCFANYSSCMVGGTASRACYGKGTVTATKQCSDYSLGKCGVSTRCVAGSFDTAAQGCSGGEVCCTNGLAKEVVSCASYSAGASCQVSCDNNSTNVSTYDCQNDGGKVCCVPKPKQPTAVIPAPTFNPDLTIPSTPTGSGLVPCGAGGNTTAGEECGFNAFVAMIQGIINFLLFTLAMPLSAISFAYAGYLYMTAATNEANIKKAHEIFTTTAIGLVIALSAWLIVSTIVSGLGVSDMFNSLLRTWGI